MKTRKTSSRTIKNEELQKDLISLREKVLGLGAADAAIIPASYVVVQERVWLKCLVPRCGGAGLSANCPPNSPKPEFMREVFSQYQWAVVFKRDVAPIEDYIPSSEERKKKITARLQNRGFVHGKTWEITGRLESYAQSKGYDLAMGFSAGSCRACLCALAPCAVLKNEACRHPLKSRPSMESVGIDVFDLASKVGWEAYMIRLIEPNLKEIPCVVSCNSLNPPLPGRFGGGDERGGELFVEGKEVFHPVPVAGERLKPLTAIHRVVQVPVRLPLSRASSHLGPRQGKLLSGVT